MLKPKRLLYLAFDVVPAPGGSSQLISATLPALSMGFQVDALTVKSEDLPHTERFHQVRLFRVPVGQASLLEQVETFGRAVRRQIESAEYDLVHCRSLFGMQAVWQRKLDLGYRIVHEVTLPPHLDLLERGAPAATVQGTARNRLREAERQALLAADLILVPSARAERRLARLGLTAPLHRVRQGLDVDRLARSSRPADPRPLEILTLGGLQPLSGYEELLAAFARVLRRHPVRLRLMRSRDPDYQASFEQTVAAYGLQEAVLITGEPSDADLPALLAQTDVCALPSRLGSSDEEGLPIELLLYLGAGRPTVAPRVEAIAELVREERDGLLYSEGSVDELTRALERLANDAELRSQLGQSAWLRVRDGWDALAMGRSLLEAYGSVEPSARKVAGRLGTSGLVGGPEPSGDVPADPPDTGRPVLPSTTGVAEPEDSSTTQRSRQAAAQAAGSAPRLAGDSEESWEVTQRVRLPEAAPAEDDDLELELEPMFVAAGSLLGGIDTAPHLLLDPQRPLAQTQELMGADLLVEESSADLELEPMTASQGLDLDEAARAGEDDEGDEHTNPRRPLSG